MSTEEVVSPVPTAPATVNADNPWPGLLAFREADQRYFQGRKTETEDLFRLVMCERLTVLFGLSGLGKSSLLQAGLFPMLRVEAVFPVYIRLDYSAPTPELVGQVMTAVGHEASAEKIEAPPTKANETLWEYFHRHDNDFWNPRNRPVMPLLVLDQFEEIFTLGCSDPSRSMASEAILEQLADLAEGRPPAAVKARIDEYPEEAREFSFTRHDYKVLISIREDFLPELEALRARMPALALNRLRLRRMDGVAAVLVVNQAPHLIDPDVADRVVRFVAADARNIQLADLEVEPALLSVVCRELNNKRQRLGEPKITADLLEGSHEQVLSDLYERSVADLPIGVRRFIEDRLLTVSGHRDSVALDNALSEPGVTRHSVDLLVERRLVRREDRGGAQRIELTHDLLCRVVRTSRDRRLQIEAAEKERRSLEEAQERDRRLRDLRDLKRTRIAAALLLGLAIAAASASVWAIRSQRTANKAGVIAEEARAYADKQRKLAEAAVQRIEQSQLIRQAALSGDRQKLDKLLSPLSQNTGIRFEAKADDLRYKNPSNQEVYKFNLYPEFGTLPTGEEAVAFITYLANHPTFQNTLMTTGADRQFHALYVGWGCLTRIVALVEYKDPTKPPTVAEFNMCSLLGWQ